VRGYHHYTGVTCIHACSLVPWCCPPAQAPPAILALSASTRCSSTAGSACKRSTPRCIRHVCTDSTWGMPIGHALPCASTVKRVFLCKARSRRYSASGWLATSSHARLSPSKPVSCCTIKPVPRCSYAAQVLLVPSQASVDASHAMLAQSGSTPHLPQA
jgi:hypothetical protein